MSYVVVLLFLFDYNFQPACAENIESIPGYIKPETVKQVVTDPLPSVPQQICVTDTEVNMNICHNGCETSVNSRCSMVMGGFID